MSRQQEIRNHYERLAALNLSDREVLTIIARLIDGKTHKELADKRAIKPESSRKFLWRLGKKMIARGVPIPKRARNPIRRTPVQRYSRAA